jgi:hypothetical protein
MNIILNALFSHLHGFSRAYLTISIATCPF